MKRFKFFVFALLIFTATQLTGQKICTPSYNSSSYSYNNYNYGPSGYSGDYIYTPPYNYFNVILNYAINPVFVPSSKFVESEAFNLHTVGLSIDFRDKNKIGWGSEIYLGFAQNRPTFKIRPDLHLYYWSEESYARISEVQKRGIARVGFKIKVFKVPTKKEKNKYQDQLFVDLDFGFHIWKSKMEHGAFNTFKTFDDKTSGGFIGANIGYRFHMLKATVGSGVFSFDGSGAILYFQAGLGIDLQIFSRDPDKLITPKTQSNYSSSSSSNLPSLHFPNSELENYFVPRPEFPKSVFPKSDLPRTVFPKSSSPKLVVPRTNFRKLSFPKLEQRKIGR